MKKNQDRSIRELAYKAKSGDVRAAFQLYQSYRDGSFVEKDPIKADEYAEIALGLFKRQSLRISTVNLIDFRAFTAAGVDHGSDNLTVLVGVNGAGKTSILDAIAHCLSWLIIRIMRPSNSGRGWSLVEHDIHHNDNGLSEYVSVVLNFNLSSAIRYEMELSKAKAGSNGSRKGAVEEIESLGALYRLANEKDSNFNMPIVAYYGVGRTIEFTKKDTNKVVGDLGDRQGKFDAYDKALDARVNFVEFFKWFKHQEEVAKFETGESQKTAKTSLALVSEAITSVIPSLKKLRIQRTPHLDMLVDKDSLTLSVGQLSQGEKSLLALVFDITRRLILLNPDVTNHSPLEGSGVVLIDEVDLHLHPGWQQRVVPNLLNTFPNIQFILTTHSPLVLSTIKREKVRLLGRNRDGEAVITTPSIHTYGEPSNDIMQALMDVDPQPPVPEKIDLDRELCMI